MATAAARLLDRVKTSGKIESDYRIAKLLGCSASEVSNWRAGRRPLSDNRIIELCELANLDPAYWLVLTHSERAETAKLSRAWRSAAERLTA